MLYSAVQQNIQVLFEFPNTDGTAGQVLQTDGYANLSFGTISSYTNSDALTLFNATGSAPVFACRAFVNFNGTGVVAIRASGNVSSITDNGTGDYTVNFTTAMPDANYSFNGATRRGLGDEGDVVLYNDTTTLTASAIRVIVGVPGTSLGTSLSPRDESSVFAQIFR